MHLGKEILHIYNQLKYKISLNYYTNYLYLIILLRLYHFTHIKRLFIDHFLFGEFA